AAYARHREIMTSLRGLLSVYDAVKTVDQVAERIARSARDELELALQTTALIADAVDGKTDDDTDNRRRRADQFRRMPTLGAKRCHRRAAARRLSARLRRGPRADVRSHRRSGRQAARLGGSPGPARIGRS